MGMAGAEDSSGDNVKGGQYMVGIVVLWSGSRLRIRIRYH